MNAACLEHDCSQHSIVNGQQQKRESATVLPSPGKIRSLNDCVCVVVN